MLQSKKYKLIDNIITFKVKHINKYTYNKLAGF